jgi:hypothetical protein
MVRWSSMKGTVEETLQDALLAGVLQYSDKLILSFRMTNREPARFHTLARKRTIAEDRFLNKGMVYNMKKQEFAHKYSGKRILIEKFLRLEEIPAELTSAFYFDVRTPIELLSKCKLDGEVITVDSDYINRYERQYSNSKVNYYSEIIADSDSKVIINIHGEKGGKLWINDICVSIHEEWSRHYVTVSLKKGLNTIFY